MKSFIYTLVISLVFIGCKKTEVPEDPEPIIFQFDFNYAYDADLNGFPFMADTTFGTITNLAYPYSDTWTVSVAALPDSYGVFGTEYDFVIEDGIGDFTFNFIAENFNGTNDSIYGTGYFSEDTLTLNYHYQSIEYPDNYGDVSIHSL